MKKQSTTSENVLTFAAAVGLLTVLIGSALPMQAFGHALSIETIDVDGVGERGIFIVIGHTSEPTFGAFPGITDGKHNVEVFLEDLDTALPLAGSELVLDKYYFEDIDSFNAADSPEDADEVVEGVAMSAVFGDPGHYIVRQVTDDGIYGYRLYGTVNYFSVAELDIDTTVFCSMGGEGGGGADTSKFNSPGWFGSYGCHDDIESIFFPEDLKNVKENHDNGNGGGGGDDKAKIRVESQLADGSEFEKFVEISDESGKVVKKGFTPVEFEGKEGEDYTIDIRHQGSPRFSHWEDGSEKRVRTITLGEDVTLIATYGNEAEAAKSKPEESTNSTTTTAGSSFGAQVQQASLGNGGSFPGSATANVAAADTSINAIQWMSLLVIPGAAIAGVFGVRSFKQSKRDQSL